MLANADMRPNRFAKLARGRRILSRMQSCFDAGGFVRIGTATRYTDYKPKHRDMFRIDAAGSLYVQRSKRWDCIDFCSFQFTA